MRDAFFEFDRYVDEHHDVPAVGRISFLGRYRRDD